MNKMYATIIAIAIVVIIIILGCLWYVTQHSPSVSNWPGVRQKTFRGK